MLHLHIVSVSFTRKRWKRWKQLKTIKTSGNLLFACQDNLNNLWLLLHRFQKFAFSMKTIRPHDNDIIITKRFSDLFILETVFKSYRFQWNKSSFSCSYKVKTQRKVCGFDENVMKTYSCRRGLKFSITKLQTYHLYSSGTLIYSKVVHLNGSGLLNQKPPKGIGS